MTFVSVLLGRSGIPGNSALTGARTRRSWLMPFRVRRDDLGVDARRARLGQTGVLAVRIDGRFRDFVVGLRADLLLQQRRDVDLHF